MKNFIFGSVFVLSISGGQAFAQVAAPTPTPVASPAPAEALVPTYASIRANVFTQKCLQCHAAGQRADDLPLDTYAAMMAEGTLVVAGDLTKSGIIDEMANLKMPPRRSGLPQVTPDELAVIRAWIVNGAPEQ